MKRLLLPLLALLLGALRASAGTPAANAVWLTRSNVTTPGLIARVPELASRLRDLHVRYLFLNSASLNRSGVTDTRAGQLVSFLDALGRWEHASHYKFTVLIWLSGSLEPSSTRHLDLASPSLRGAVAAEAGQYLDPKAPGGPVAGSARAPDGVLLDFQPLGGDPALLGNYTLLLDAVKKAAHGRKVATAAHKLGFDSEWQLSESAWHRLAQHADYLAALTYNSGEKSAPDYQAWIKDQTRRILRAVSGATWKNDASHPAPRDGVKVFISFPAFPADAKNHLVGVEQIAPAAAGTKAALAALDAPSRSCFEGAAIYALSDGESDNGYAQWNTDLAAFRAAWLAP